MIFFVLSHKINNGRSQYLANMKTVTKQAFNQLNSFFSHQQLHGSQQIEESNSFTPFPSSHSYQHLQLQTQAIPQQNNIQNVKFQLYDTCSTEDTESNAEECNKENIQIWTESHHHSTIRAQTRPPLKDITHQVIKNPSKRHPQRTKSQLCDYMDALFPSSKPTALHKQRRVLRI